MGFGMPYVTYLSNKGYLNKPGLAVLDIGSQCLLAATREAIQEFLKRHGRKQDQQTLSDEVERIAYFSTPRPGERTAYLSELFDLTDISYTSYDVCPALKTEIFDLNRESVPSHYREHFDVILNFGTTEHVINQFNSFRVMHDALAVGGVAMHQLPSTGWIDHGYFCYHLTLFHDLAKSNNYEIIDSWYTPTGTSDFTTKKIDLRLAETPESANSATSSDPGQIPNFLVNVVLRKRASQPFRLPLELATAHAALSGQVANEQEVPPAAGGGTVTPTPQPALLQPQNPTLSNIPGRALARELKIRLLRRVFGPTYGVKFSSADKGFPIPAAVPAVSVSTQSVTAIPAVSQTISPALVNTSLEAQFHYGLGKASQDAGRIEEAFGHYRRALALVHKYGPARAQMQTMSVVYAAEARKSLDNSDTASAKRLLIRALELDPDNGDASSRLEKIIADEGKRDLTRHCFVFHDPKRAETVHREAVLRCLEYVSIAGVVGDVLEFGVLAGWSSRIFCESMRNLMSPADIHLFDSFDGLPDYISDVDIKSYEIAGRNIWSDKMRFTDDFQKDLGSTIDVHVRDRLSDIISAERIHVYRGFYSDSLKKPLKVKAAIVHIDCDLYQSTVEVLWALYKQEVFQDGCVLMFDDWNCNKASPNYGERKAFQEFMEQQDRYTSSVFFTYGFNGAAFFLHDRTA